MYDATHHFPLAHCSQYILEDFFSLVYLPFSSQPLALGLLVDKDDLINYQLLII